MTVIDIHTHVFTAKKPIPQAYMDDPHWDLADRILGPEFRAKAERQEHLSIEAYVESMDEWGIDKVCINNVALTAEGARAMNVFNAEIVAEYPDRVIGFAAVPMAAEEHAARELEFAVESLGFKGAKIYPWLHGIPLDDPQLRPLFEAAAELDVPILTHTMSFPRAYTGAGGIDWLDPTYDNPMRVLESGVLQDLPNLKLIFAHLGGGIVFYRDMILRRNPDLEPLLDLLYVDICPAVHFGEDEVRAALDALGPQRVLFGLDYPWIDLEESSRCVEHVKAMDFSESTKDAILGSNAARLLHL